MSKIYRCFIASPSDTPNERETCEKVFFEINKSLGRSFDFVLESIKWENDTRPAFGQDGQDVINKQVGDEYDVFIGIMYKKFGSSTPRFGSGTEEEFTNAYERYKSQDNVEIMFYFNVEPPKSLNEINPQELERVNAFRNKIAELGGLYSTYSGVDEFESKLRIHLSSYLSNLYNGKKIDKEDNIEIINFISQTYQNRLNSALSMFSAQPIIWVEPVLSTTNEISQNPDDNYNNKINIDDLIIEPTSTIIKAPPQFGLSSLAHYLTVRAWESKKLWIYIDSAKSKAHTINNVVKNELEHLRMSEKDIKCIILDSWNIYENTELKKVKNLCESYPNVPIILMQTIDDHHFLDPQESEECIIDRDFAILHLLALPRNHIRKVVSEYNKAKSISDEDALLNKLVNDLEKLNIHRTPHNCLTLLKVAENYFDESPINRTKMLEMVLFILFNMDDLPVYQVKPDLKDCEFVLGRFCEILIRNNQYEFSKETILTKLKDFCIELLIDLEVETVFDILRINNIIVKRDLNYAFRSSFWIFYFAAKRMHNDKDFADYIFASKKYSVYPELIEFYTGIDRSRDNALEILIRDINETCSIVVNKIGMSDNFNPLSRVEWKPSEQAIERMHSEIGSDVLNSRLPDIVKDQFADKTYNQVKPYCKLPLFPGHLKV